MRQKHDTIESHQIGQDYRVHKNPARPLNVMGSATHRSGQGLGRGPYHGNHSIELGPGVRRSGPGPGSWRDGPTRWTHRSGPSPGRGPYHGNRSIELGPGVCRSGTNPEKVPDPGAWRDGPTRTHGSELSPGGVQSHCHSK